MTSVQELPLKVKKLSEDATIPTKGSALAAGFDLYASQPATILPGERAVVKTDISIKCPPGTFARIAPRSGLAIKKGIDCGAGVVDADYRGPIGVVLFNLDKSTTFEVQKGDRIAQLILEVRVGIEEVDDLEETGVSVKKSKTDEKKEVTSSKSSSMRTNATMPRKIIVLPTKVDRYDSQEDAVDFPIDEDDYRAVYEILAKIGATRDEIETHVREMVEFKNDDEERRIYKLRMSHEMCHEFYDMMERDSDWLTYDEKGKLHPSIGQLSSLQELDLRGFEDESSIIHTLPEEIGNLTNLERLSCNAASLPPSVGRLRNLKDLCLASDYSKEVVLREEIGDLVSLERLDLSELTLSTIPAWIGNLQNLKYLSLMETEVSSLPEGIGKLVNLETLILTDYRLASLHEYDLDCTANLSSLPERAASYEQWQGYHINDSYFTKLISDTSKYSMFEDNCRILRMLSQRSGLLVSLGPGMDCLLKTFAKQKTAAYAKKLRYVLAYNRTLSHVQRTPVRWPYLIDSASPAFDGDPDFIYQLLVDERKAFVEHLVNRTKS